MKMFMVLGKFLQNWTFKKLGRTSKSLCPGASFTDEEAESGQWKEFMFLL